MLGRLAVRRAGRVAMVTFGAGRAAPAAAARLASPGVVALRRVLAEGVAARRRQRARTRWPTRWAASASVAAPAGLVVVISDFRDQHGWTRPLGALRARHSVLAVEVARPARGRAARRRAPGRRRPRDRRARWRSTPRAARARALRRARARAPRDGRARAAPAARRARRAVDRWRLAARAGAEAAVSFAIARSGCSALLLVPLALLAYQAEPPRARRRYAVRFTGRPDAAAAPRARCPPGAATCRPRSRSRRSPRSCSRWPSRRSTVAVPIERASIMLVTDHSRSMQATDVEPDRLAAAQRAARTFLDQLPDQVRVGVVAFSDAPDAVQAPERRPRRRAARSIDGQVADGATATGDGARRSRIDALKHDRQNGKRPPSAIVLLSDGKTTVRPRPGRRSPRTAGPAEDPDLHGRPRHARRDRAQPRPVRPAAARSRPTPRRCARSPQVSGGKAFTAEDAEHAEVDLQDARLAAGHQAAEEADHGELRGRRARAAARRRRASSLRWAGRLP